MSTDMLPAFELRRYLSSMVLDVSLGDDELAYITIERDANDPSRADMRVEFWPARMTPAHFLRIHRKVKQLIQSAHLDGIARIQFAVDAGDDKGHRWAGRALGFEPEGLLRCYAKGRNHVMYSHIDRLALQHAKSRAA